MVVCESGMRDLDFVVYALWKIVAYRSRPRGL